MRLTTNQLYLGLNEKKALSLSENSAVIDVAKTASFAADLNQKNQIRRTLEVCFASISNLQKL